MVSVTVDSAKALPGRIVRKTAVEWVLDDLRQRILCGAITPGAALRQEALAVAQILAIVDRLLDQSPGKKLA